MHCLSWLLLLGNCRGVTEGAEPVGAIIDRPSILHEPAKSTVGEGLATQSQSFRTPPVLILRIPGERTSSI